MIYPFLFAYPELVRCQHTHWDNLDREAAVAKAAAQSYLPVIRRTSVENRVQIRWYYDSVPSLPATAFRSDTTRTISVLSRQTIFETEVLLAKIKI
jgi:hypothetical protein